MALPSIQELRAERARQQSSGRRWVRRLAWTAACLVVLGLAIYFIAPPIIRSQLEKRLSAELNREVTVGRVKLNPCTLSVTVEQFAIQARDGEKLLGWARLFVNFDSFSLFTGEWRFQEIAVDALEGSLIVMPDGSLSVQDLVAKYSASAAAPAQPPELARPLRIRTLAVSQARFHFVDHSRSSKFETQFGPVTFSLTNFVTRQGNQAPYAFAATTESGESIEWKGTLSAVPLASIGELSLGGIALKKYAPYYRDFVRFDVREGTFDVKGRYEADLTGEVPVVRLHEGFARLSNLQLAARDGAEPALAVRELTVTGIEADTAQRSATVARVAVSGGRVHVRRLPSGEIDLATLLAPVFPQTGVAGAPASSAPAPSVKVGQVAVEAFAVTVEDHTTPRVATIPVSKLDLKLDHFELGSAAPMPVQIEALFASGGFAKLEGSLALDPMRADLSVTVAGLPLAYASPYVESFVNVRVAQGTFSTKGRVQATLPPSGAPELTFVGETSVEQLLALDGAALQPLAGWASLAIKGIDFSTAKNALTIEEIAWHQPSAHVVVRKDGALNLASVMPAAPAPTPAPAVALPAVGTTAAPGMQLTLGRFTLDDAALTFADHSLPQGVQVSLQQFGGTVTGLSSDAAARATVDLHGLIDGLGRVEVAGSLYPFGRQAATDMKVQVRSMDLVPFSPYSGKFAGYALARGKLMLDVKVALADRKLDSATLLTLDQFTFGTKTDSPDATGLPVRLAVALLKDTKGQIVVDMPVQGSLDDPEFKIGRVVWRVIGNLLTKAATSPFSLLGSMFGGGGEELSYCEFLPGTATLGASELAKLETLQKALAARPGLNLDLSGSFDATTDVTALRHVRLDQQLRAKIWEVRRAREPELPAPELIVVTPEEREAMIKTLFVAEHPEALAGLLAAQAVAPAAEKSAVKAAPASVPASRGVLHRFLDFVLGRKPEASGAQVATEAASKKTTLAATAGVVPLEITVAQMEEALLAGIEVTEADMGRLALDRAQAVQSHLLRSGIAADRLFLSAGSAGAGQGGTRVNLELK
jgi:hypothetical protein